MSNATIIAQLHGTSMPEFSGYEKPALGGRVWRQRPALQLAHSATGIDVSTTDNFTRVSEGDHRHT
jgi:hypothetical protein